MTLETSASSSKTTGRTDSDTIRAEQRLGPNNEFSKSRSAVSPRGARPPRTLPCPFFEIEKARALPHSCNGLNARTMAEVRKHLLRPHRHGSSHLPFLRLCATCKRHIIDEDEFVREHGYDGELCHTSRKASRGAEAVEADWMDLYELLFPHATPATTLVEEAADPFQPHFDNFGIQHNSDSGIQHKPGSGIQHEFRSEIQHNSSLWIPHNSYLGSTSYQAPEQQDTSTCHSLQRRAPAAWSQVGGSLAESLSANSNPSEKTAAEAPDMSQASRGLPEDVLSTSTSDTPEVLQCPLKGCKSTFTGNFRKNNFRRHLRTTHQQKEHICMVCGTLFKRRDALSKHTRLKHPESAARPSASDSIFSLSSTPTTYSLDGSLPYGLMVLHDSDDSKVDIIFIHGLTGDRVNTWRAKDSTGPWPKDLLPSTIPNARILTFGYDAYVADWQGMVSGIRIGNYAMDLLSAIATFRGKDDTDTRPIIFVCHSLGGLVCKDALATARQRPEEHFKRVLNCARGIAFLGTPQDSRSFARGAECIARGIGLLKQTNADILAVLMDKSEVLERIHEEFHAMIRSRMQDGLPEISITCFFEEVPLPGIGIVVPSDSATLPGYKSMSIRGNHIDMTKFKAVTDPGFNRVAYELRRWVEGLAQVETSASL